jgi:hypothetical protein
MSGGSGGGESISWVSVCILALAMVGVVSNAACVAILAWKKRSSMFHKLLKVRKKHKHRQLCCCKINIMQIF